MATDSLARLMLIMAVTAVATTTPTPAQGASPAIGDPIPVAVVGPPRAVEYPQPICPRCPITTKREMNAEGAGKVDLVYRDDVVPVFHGDVEFTLLLADGTEHTIIVTEVTLEQEEAIAWTVNLSPQWTWLEVDYIWVEFVPAT